MPPNERLESLGVRIEERRIDRFGKFTRTGGVNAQAAVMTGPIVARQFDAGTLQHYPTANSAPRFVGPDGKCWIIFRASGPVTRVTVSDGRFLNDGSRIPLPGVGWDGRWEVELPDTLPEINPGELMPPERPIDPSNHRPHPMSAATVRDNPMSAVETAQSYVRKTPRGHENKSLKEKRDLFNSSPRDEVDWGGWWSDEIDEWELVPKKAPKAEYRQREMKAAVFRLARRLKGIGAESMSREQLKPGIETWLTRIRRIPGWDRVTVEEVMALLPPWNRIKHALGTKVSWWAEVTSAAEKLLPPAAVKFKFPKDVCKHRLAMLCEAAAVQNGHRAFVLPARKTGEFIGCKKSKAAELLNLFVENGWLKLKCKGRYRHGGSRFVWTFRRESKDFDSVL